MSLTNQQKHIVLGSGKLYLMDWVNSYAETLPSDAEIETDAHRILIKNGAKITYSTESTTVKDDFSIASRTYTSSEEGKFTTGVACCSPEIIPYLTGTATVTKEMDTVDPTKVKSQTAKFGGAGNDTGKTYLARFVYSDNESDVRITCRGVQTGEMEISFSPEEASFPNMELTLSGVDDAGHLVIYKEEYK